MKILSKEELTDVIYGCTILGTGGGGELQAGLDLIEQALGKGKEFRLVSFDEVEDDALIGTPYMCGAISPETEENIAKYAHLPQLSHHSVFEAVRAMEKHFGEPFTGLVSTELGGANTAVALYAAAMLDKVIIDADPAGRSVPELQHSTYYINNIPIHPLSVANDFGDVAVLPRVVDDFRAEALVRSLAVVSNDSVSVVDHPARAKDLRNAMIKGAISYSMKIGKAFREAKEKGGKIAEEVAKEGKGIMLFKGRVSKFGYKTEGGFTLGETVLEGTGEYAGHTYKVWYKNEHIFSWLDNEVDVTVPDLICMIDDEKAMPVTNPYYEKGMNISVFALPAPLEWRTERGMEIFGPASFGRDYQYRPISDR